MVHQRSLEELWKIENVLSSVSVNLDHVVLVTFFEIDGYICEIIINVQAISSLKNIIDVHNKSIIQLEEGSFQRRTLREERRREQFRQPINHSKHFPSQRRHSNADIFRKRMIQNQSENKTVYLRSSSSSNGFTSCECSPDRNHRTEEIQKKK